MLALFDERRRCFVQDRHNGSTVAPDIVLALKAKGQHGDWSLDAPETISISQFPARLKIVLSNSDGAPRWWLRAEGRFDQTRLDALPEGLQTVTRSTWHPLFSNEVELLARLLGIKPGDALPSISLRLLVGLCSNTDATRMLVHDGISLSSFVEELVQSSQGDESFPLAKGIALRPYQELGSRWMARILDMAPGCVLADEMGLGKSIQMIAVISRAVSLKSGPVLVVLPSSLIANWQRELVRFAPHLSWLVHRGSSRATSVRDLALFDVVITTYDILVSDQSLFVALDFTMLVCDEAHYFRNPDTARFKALAHIRNHHSSKPVIAATGTPIQNGLRDAWALFEICVPGWCGNRAKFDKTYKDNVESAVMLETRLTPLLLRRRVDDVLDDLPPRIDLEHELEMTDQEALYYEELRKRALIDGGGLASISPLRQFCAHPSLVSSDWQKAQLETSTKFHRLIELILEIRALGGKVLVFCSFTGMSNLIATHLSSQIGLWARVLNGTVPIETRQALVDDFSTVSGPAALIVNPTVGGVGLNIQAASHVVHYTLEWNPAVVAQATARAYRSGQKSVVRVHYLFYRNTIESVMWQRLDRKQQLSEAAISGVQPTEENELALALSVSPLLSRNPEEIMRS